MTAPLAPADAKGHGASRTEVAAFVGMILSVMFLVTYIAWAVVPDSVLISFGVSYFPNKYWAVALPLYFVMLALFTVICYVALSMYYNPDLSDLRLAEDKFSKVLFIPPSPPFPHVGLRVTPPARAWR
jgi:phosphatidylinositol glycan class P protein